VDQFLRNIPTLDTKIDSIFIVHCAEALHEPLLNDSFGSGVGEVVNLLTP